MHDYEIMRTECKNVLRNSVLLYLCQLINSTWAYCYFVYNSIKLRRDAVASQHFLLQDNLDTTSGNILYSGVNKGFLLMELSPFFKFS